MRPTLFVLPVLLFIVSACSDRSTETGVAPETDATATTQAVAANPPPAVRAPTPLPPPQTRVLQPTGTADGPASHDAARALEHARILSTEPRVSGTPAEERAAQYIADAFRSYGYVVEIQEFDFDGDRFRAGEVTVGDTLIESLTMAGSPGGFVSAPSAYIGLADATGIAGQDLSGKIAIADRGILNFSEKYENARTAGAIGMVIVNNQAGLFSGNLTLEADLIEAARRGDRVSITTPPTIGLTRSMNIVAKASTDTLCHIVVGGHFDSVPSAPGANDNASGTSNVLELSRAMAVDGVDEGVCFVTFGAEESGLYGSREFVSRIGATGFAARYMINLDVTGIGAIVEVIGDSALADRAIVLARNARIPVAASVLPANSGSDHQSFAEVGTEVVFFTSGSFGTIHSPEDVFADLDIAMLGRIGDAALLTLREILPEVAAG